MRLKLFPMTALAMCVLAAAPAAHADNLGRHWQDARIKWNAVGDKAAAGDQAAQQQLMDAAMACAPETECFQNRGNPPEAERAQLQAAWDACEKGPAPDVCRRNLHALTPAQIDAAAAALNIAWIFANGKLGEPNNKQALDHYLFAAEFQHPIGHYNVGKMIMDGKAGAPDLSEAATRYLKAGRLGVVDAWIALGDLRQKHPSERPFIDTFFAMSASEGYSGRAWYKDPDFFYRRALAENPSDAQKEKINEKLAAIDR